MRFRKSTCAPPVPGAYVPYAVVDMRLRVRHRYARLTSLTLWRKCCSNQFKVLDKFPKILDNVYK